MSDPIVNLIGEELVQQGGTIIKTKEAISDDVKVVAIYFSAHWCPPCRVFTPELAEQYKSKLKGLGMEIIFSSGDKDENSFNNYFKEMPWLALPYTNRELNDKLKSKYRILGIPTLIILDRKTGKLNTSNGRGAIKDPDNFPFKDTPSKCACC